jgi:hypothetical protein
MPRLDDGFSTVISFAEDTSVALYEKSVTPPGVQGGGEIDTTTMLNEVWRTRNPKQLKTLSEASFTAAYGAEVYPEIVALVNVNNLITITFPDGATLEFWGWLDEFMPGELVEGEQPTAEVTLIPSNQTAAGEEVAPVFTPAA